MYGGNTGPRAVTSLVRSRLTPRQYNADTGTVFLIATLAAAGWPFVDCACRMTALTSLYAGFPGRPQSHQNSNME